VDVARSLLEEREPRAAARDRRDRQRREAEPGAVVVDLVVGVAGATSISVIRTRSASADEKTPPSPLGPKPPSGVGTPVAPPLPVAPPVAEPPPEPPPPLADPPVPLPPVCCDEAQPNDSQQAAAI